MSGREAYVDRAQIEAAVALVGRSMAPTPCVSWPQINELVGCEVWVKHENHTPIGAFKLRGGIVYMHELRRRDPRVTAVVTGASSSRPSTIAS